MNPELHNLNIKYSEEHRTEILERRTKYYEAFDFVCQVLKAFDYQKYLVFNYLVYDQEKELSDMNIALSMTAYFLSEREKGRSIDDTYLKSFILSYIGTCSFVIFPGGKKD